MRISDWSSDVCSSDLAPYLVERILGRVRQRGDARQRQESRAALDRVNEAKDRVEPLAVAGVRLPRDDGAPRLGKDFRRLGEKVVQQIIHRGNRCAPKSKRDHARQWLREPLPAALQHRTDEQRGRRDRKSTRLNSSHYTETRMPSSD